MATFVASQSHNAFFPQPALWIQPGTLDTNLKCVDMQSTQWLIPVQLYVQQIPLTQSPLQAASATWYGQDNVPDINHSGCWGLLIAEKQQAVPVAAKKGPLDVQGKVWALARSAQGSRDIQQVLDDTTSDDVRVDLSSELRSHVWPALKCRHANHVLQKCISIMRRQDFQFIIDELLQTGGPVAFGRAARQRYGCRVIQRLLEHCSPEQLEVVVEELLSDAVELCKDMWGVYVMQHLFEHGAEKQLTRLLEILTEHAAKLGTDEFAPQVLIKALSHAGSEQRRALALELIAQPELLTEMACQRHGEAALEEALELVDAQAKLAAITYLMSKMDLLMSTRYGRRLAGLVEKHVVN